MVLHIKICLIYIKQHRCTIIWIRTHKILKIHKLTLTGFQVNKMCCFGKSSQDLVGDDSEVNHQVPRPGQRGDYLRSIKHRTKEKWLTGLIVNLLPIPHTHWILLQSITDAFSSKKMRSLWVSNILCQSWFQVYCLKGFWLSLEGAAVFRYSWPDQLWKLFNITHPYFISYLDPVIYSIYSHFLIFFSFPLVLRTALAIPSPVYLFLLAAVTALYFQLENHGASNVVCTHRWALLLSFSGPQLRWILFRYSLRSSTYWVVVFTSCEIWIIHNSFRIFKGLLSLSWGRPVKSGKQSTPVFWSFLTVFAACSCPKNFYPSPLHWGWWRVIDL